MATLLKSDPVKQQVVLNDDGYAASESEEESSTPLSSQMSNGIPASERVKQHAKRPSKNGVCQVGLASPSDTSPTDVNMKKFMKNSRRSRGRFGRGLTKKGILCSENDHFL